MTPKVCGAYIHTYVVKRGKSVIAIVAFTTALLVRAVQVATYNFSAAAIWHSIYFKPFFSSHLRLTAVT